MKSVILCFCGRQGSEHFVGIEGRMLVTARIRLVARRARVGDAFGWARSHPTVQEQPVRALTANLHQSLARCFKRTLLRLRRCRQQT